MNAVAKHMNQDQGSQNGMRESGRRNLLTIDKLSVGFGSKAGMLNVVSGMSLAVGPGETVAIVGESGSGKSVASMAILGLHSGLARVTGQIWFRREDAGEADLAALSNRQMRKIRGADIAMIFQEPMTSLNPVFKISDQLTEGLFEHQKVTAAQARAKALEMLELVGIPNAKQRLDAYPHELSGGMRQRVMIAMALMCSPKLLIADEPTTALDVTIQAQILDLLKSLQQRNNMGVIFITHDLGVVNEIADRVYVMYSGRIVEEGPVSEVMQGPKHPYTRGLMDSIPQMGEGEERVPLRAIPGSIPNLANPPKGCRFHPRCIHAVEGRCDAEEPDLMEAGANRRVRCLRWDELNLSGGTQ